MSSKWLLEHHGRGVSLARRDARRDLVQGVAGRSGPAAAVARRIAQVRLSGRREPVLLLVEFCTYPEKRPVEQMMDDLRLVHQVAGCCPMGWRGVAPEGEVRDTRRGYGGKHPGLVEGNAALEGRTVVDDAGKEMLTSPDVGVVPWVS